MDLEHGTSNQDPIWSASGPSSGEPIAETHASKLSSHEYLELQESIVSRHMIARCVTSGGRPAYEEDQTKSRHRYSLPRQDTYIDWYLTHLDHKVQSFLRQSNSEGTPAHMIFAGVVPPEHQEAFMFDALRTTADVLKSTNRSLTKIAAAFPRHRSSTSDDSYHQLAFILISWITLLFTADESPPPSSLRLHINDPRHQHKKLRTTTWRRLTCPLNDAVAQSTLHHLLSNFGNFKLKHRDTSAQQDKLYFGDKLIAANVNYDTIHKMAKIRIEWVDALSLHLEFDTRTSVIKMFRFPSLCASLICSNNEESDCTTFLSQLFTSDRPEGSHSSINDDSDSDSEDEDVASLSYGHKTYCTDHLLEVLHSYRLIFSQHKKSRAAFKRFFWTSAQRKCADPLLEQLCSVDPEEQAINRDIELPRIKSVYSLRADFPWLGRRLWDLQDYVTAQHPSSLRALWYDRRDILRFHTFWAVVFIGGLSLILSTIQLGLTAAQVALQIKYGH